MFPGQEIRFSARVPASSSRLHLLNSRWIPGPGKRHLPAAGGSAPHPSPASCTAGPPQAPGQGACLGFACLCKPVLESAAAGTARPPLNDLPKLLQQTCLGEPARLLAWPWVTSLVCLPSPAPTPPVKRVWCALCLYFPPSESHQFQLFTKWVESPLLLIRSFSVLLAAEREVVGAQGDREIRGGQPGLGILPQKQRAKPKKEHKLVSLTSPVTVFKRLPGAQLFSGKLSQTPASSRNPN